MQESRLRIGVLGAGKWAESAHIPDWLRDPRCEVVALCDVEGERNQGSFEDGARVQQVVNAAERSYRERRWVELPLER